MIAYEVLYVKQKFYSNSIKNFTHPYSLSFYSVLQASRFRHRQNERPPVAAVTDRKGKNRFITIREYRGIDFPTCMNKAAVRIQRTHRIIEMPVQNRLCLILARPGVNGLDIPAIIHDGAVLQRYVELISSCNGDEKEILLRTLKFLKALLSEFGI